MDKKETHNKQYLGSGWAFPVSFSYGNAELRVTQYEQNVNENIQTILNTKRGERPMQLLFGSGLKQFMFRKMDDTLKGEIMDTIKSSLLTYEPRITVISVEVEFTDILNGTAEVTIVYDYNQTNTRHNYVFPFNLIEGTNITQ